VLNGDIKEMETRRLLSTSVVLEVGELNGMHQKEVTAFKLFMTIDKDKIRDLYANGNTVCPRRAVMWGTTNENEYLKDTTGNRRFWPIEITKVNFNWLEENREKLWKTAYRDYLAGASTYPTKEEEELYFASEQEKRRERDILEDLILPYLVESMDMRRMSGQNAVTLPIGDQFDTQGVARWWTSAQLLTLLAMSHTDKWDNKRLGIALRKYGWESVNKLINGKQRRVWIKS
jgi:predicted P-loop ATPase